MTKSLTLPLAALMIWTLVGCGEQQSPPPATTTDAADVETAADDGLSDATQATADIVEAAATATAVNGMCPLSGKDIDPDGLKLSYKGKVIGFCCANCPTAFQKDPEAAMAKLGE